MKNRILYVDLLRILAVFSVVFLHVAAGNWANVNIGTFEWNVLNFYDSAVRFGVPIFVMISGMFLLNPEKNISCKDIYCKYILRIVVSLFSWSLLYAVYTNIINSNTFNVDSFIKSLIFGHYHLWYLYMIIGLYIITPFVRKIVLDKKTIEYFLLLSLIFTFLIPIIIKIYSLESLNLFVKKFEIYLIFGYVGYYVAGYYFYTYSINKYYKNVVYILGFIGIAITYIFTNIISLKTGKADSTFYSYFSPNVMISSVAIFVFFKYEVSKVQQLQLKLRTINLITTMSDCSFGVYLVHDFFNMFLGEMGFNTLNYNPILSVPFAAITVFILSFITSYLISRIPLLKRIL